MGDAVLTQFFSGFSLVAILIIAALGLAVIFGVAGVINMAHGEFIMVGAYVASVVQSGLGGNTFWSIPICFVAVGMLGLVVERTVIRGLYDRPLETLLATWGVSLILIVIIKMIFGTELHYVGSPEMLQGGFPAPGNLPFPWYRLFLILLSILLLIATFDVESGFSFTRFLLVSYWLSMVCLVAGGRFALRSLQRRLLISGIGRQKALIVGTDERGERLLQDLNSRPVRVHDVVGFVRARNDAERSSVGGVPVLGQVGDSAYWTPLNVHRLLVQNQSWCKVL